MRAPTLIECSWLDGRDLAGRGRIVAPSQQMSSSLLAMSQKMAQLSAAGLSAADSFRAARAVMDLTLVKQKRPR